MNYENTRTEQEWKPHSCYRTKGEAETKAARVMLLWNKMTRVTTEMHMGKERYWIEVAHGKPVHSPINNELGDYNA